MTFTPITDLPNPEPDARIYFHGLLLLRSEDGATCEVGVHPSATNHTLSVEVRTRRPKKPDVIHMRHFGNLHGRRPGMSIEVGGFTETPVAYKHTPAQPPNFDTGVGVDTDFRWIMNLEGSLFHEQQLDSDIFQTQHLILIQRGKYYFHCADRTRDLPIRRVGGNKPDRMLASIASIVGANLYLNDGQSIVVRWNDGGQQRVLELKKPPAGIIHEVYIENSPLYEDTSSSGGHSELVEYYKVLKGHGSVQFNLEIGAGALGGRADTLESQSGYDKSLTESGSGKFNILGSARIPCQSAVLDGVESTG